MICKVGEHMLRQHFNYHTHTTRCGHAEGSDEQMIRAAIMAGFDELGFSEHIPFPCVDKPGERMLNKDVPEYFQTLTKLKEKYADKIKIFIGLEIEYFDDQLAYLQEMRKQCDYMIVGQHCQFVDGGGYDYFNDDEAVQIYGKQLCDCMRSGLISMVAHPDYFMLGRREFSKVCEEVAHKICACAVECDIPLEINLNGMRYGKLLYENENAYPYPYRAFWEIAETYPIQVMYGFDAHRPVTLLEQRRIDDAEEILKGLKFQFVDTFMMK